MPWAVFVRYCMFSRVERKRRHAFFCHPQPLCKYGWKKHDDAVEARFCIVVECGAAGS